MIGGCEMWHGARRHRRMTPIHVMMRRRRWRRRDVGAML